MRARLGLTCLLFGLGAFATQAAGAEEPGDDAARIGPRSGYAWLGPELRALQDDAFANPGMLWIDRGRRL